MRRQAWIRYGFASRALRMWDISLNLLYDEPASKETP